MLITVHLFKVEHLKLCDKLSDVGKLCSEGFSEICHCKITWRTLPYVCRRRSSYEESYIKRRCMSSILRSYSQDYIIGTLLKVSDVGSEVLTLFYKSSLGCCSSFRVFHKKRLIYVYSVIYEFRNRYSKIWLINFIFNYGKLLM